MVRDQKIFIRSGNPKIKKGTPKGAYLNLLVGNLFFIKTKKILRAMQVYDAVI
jgi:hypothetical protein